MKNLITASYFLLLSACSYHYDVSEQEINQYLAKHQSLQQQLSIPGLLQLEANVDQLQVEIGHQQQRIRLNSQANLQLSSLLYRFDANLNSAISAEPWYDAENGAIYLRELRLEKVNIEPQEMAAQIQALLPQLNFIMNQVLQETPIYVLDAQDNYQGIAKKWGQTLQVTPGNLTFTLAP